MRYVTFRALVRRTSGMNIDFANNEPCACGAPLRMKLIVPYPLISEEVPCRCATSKGRKMGYTSGDQERAEVG